MMNPEKQKKKILKCMDKAYFVTSRAEAQKILKKHDKAVKKLDRNTEKNLH
jgi:hypothetical protein